jgi:hypothetical protein
MQRGPKLEAGGGVLTLALGKKECFFSEPAMPNTKEITIHSLMKNILNIPSIVLNPHTKPVPQS